ncbi:MAG TPA: hypothetical protein PKC87_00560 [Candidatus Absconditabacterales bacterium]|nr:hypothetical protein [Candidatus Absconditabacterales bacterium]
MRLSLENTFVLDLDFERGKRYGGRDTRKELDESFERFFNIMGKDPDKLITLMDTAVNKEVKKRMLLTLVETELTGSDETHFKPLTSEDVDNLEKENGSRSNNVRNTESSSQPVEGFVHGNEPSKKGTEGAS